MTQRDPAQDFDPKHRIIGAVVVVALGVIFIPMILGNRGVPPAGTAPAGEQTRVAISQVAPPAPAAEPLPAAPPTAPATPAPAAPVPADTAPAAKTMEADKAAAPRQTKQTQVAKAQAPETRAVASGWVVQVGTFTDTANAARLESRLRSQGQAVLTERIELDGRKAVRLRVGPFAERAAALRAQQRIEKHVGVKGVVLAYP
ncbi:MAG TPA: SPOR domain-containing protein [Burkholderiales bacterium]